jgi:histidine decarboxylase
VPTSLIDARARQRLNVFMSQLDDYFATYIGFPATLDFDYSELLPIMNLFLNNIGDPHVSSWYKAHTKSFEQEVVAWCADLFRAPADDYWGYVTHGSTESILYALYMAREKLPGAAVYYSEAAHYGVPKNIHILSMEGIPVRAQPSGEMDYGHLEQLLAERPDKPAIVLATIGTTMTEARDNVHTIQQLLVAHGTPHHIHADAALTGVYAALLTPHHPFDFQDGADSVSVSGHKFFGSPQSCGVIVTKKQDQQLLGQAANYTGSTDTTISGSRNGHTPLFLWYAIQRFGVTGFRRRAIEAQKMAAYTHEQLQRIGWKSWRNPQALTVMLAGLPAELITKWQLATHDGWSHIICMPGVSKKQIDTLIGDVWAYKRSQPGAIVSSVNAA